MSSKVYRFLFIFLCVFISHCQEEEDIKKLTPGESKTEILSTNHGYYYIELTNEQLSSYKYLRVFTDPDPYSNPAKLYISQTEKHPSSSKKEFFSQKSNNNLYYVPFSQLDKSINKVYIGVQCELNCNFEITPSLVNDIELSVENNNEISFNPFDEVSSFTYKASSERELLVYSHGESASFFTMEIFDSNSNLIKVDQVFYDGYASNINLSEYPQGQLTIKIKVKKDDLSYMKDKKITLGVQFIDDTNNKPISVYPLDKVYGYTDQSNSNELCYSLQEYFETDKKYYMFIQGFTQSLQFSIRIKTTYVVQYEQIVYFNNYIEIPSEYIYGGLNNFCISPLQGSTSPISFSFQIITENHFASHQAYIAPLFNGVQNIHMIPKQSIITYRHNTIYPSSASLTSHLKAMKGSPVLYLYKCYTFPDCAINDDKLSELILSNNITTVHDINKEYIIKTTDISDEGYLDNTVQLISVVKCESKEENCQYIIEMNNDNNNIEMLPELEYSQGILNEEHYYTFRINDITKINKVTFYMTSLTGNCDVNIFTDSERTKQIDLQSSYRFSGSKEIFEISSDIQNNYYITVSSKEMGYYMLMYSLNHPNIEFLHSGIVNVAHISKNDNSRTYAIDNDKKDSEYVIKVSALNCVPSITFNGVEYTSSKTFEKVIAKDDPLMKDSSFYLNINVDNFDSGSSNDDEYCTLLISGSQEEIVLTEGNVHSTVISKETTKTFIYPLMYTSSSESVLLSVDLEKKGEISVSIGVNTEPQPFIKYELYRSRTFVIKENMKNYCTLKTQCSIVIVVYSKEGAEFSLLLKNNEKVPTYIEKDTVKVDRIYPGEKHYFYTDIKKEEGGELVVNFKKGNGNVFSKIISKDQFEDNANWNHRVHLPIDKESGDNVLTYNSITKQIIYSANDTQKCEKGCEMYFGISAEDLFYSDNRPTEVSFYISTKKDKDIPIVSIPIEEYINGYLNSVDSMNYYTMTIPYTTSGILISYKSPYAKLLINHNKDSITEETAEKTITDDNSYLIITASEYGLTTLKDVKFNFAVKLTELRDLNQYYMFKVSPLYNTVKTIKAISSEHSEQCDIDANDYCVYLLDISSYEKVSNVFLYGYDMNDKSKYLSFYAKKVKKSEFNSKYYDSDISSYIPSKESYDYSIEQSNTFSIDDIDINSDYMLLISIYSQTKTKINLISSYYFGSEMVNLLPHTEQMFHIRKGEDLKVNVINNYPLTMKNYLFDTVTVKGKAKTIIDKSSKVIEGNYIVNIQDKDQQEEFIIVNSEESDLVVILKYTFRDVNNNIVELSNDMMNVIDMGFNFFPLAAYFPIENINTINNIINVNFDDIEYKQQLTKKDDFDLKGYIVDNSFIEERKKNSSAIPSSSQMKSIYYSDEHIGFISYKKEQNDDGKYLFVLIDKSSTNKNEYSKITTSLFAYNEEVPKYSLPQMKYIYGACEKGKKVLYKMDTNENDEKVYEIEFASSPYINKDNKTQFLIYSIESYTETPTFANETDIIKSSQFDNGKNVIILNTNKSILFTVIANDFDMDFAVKYKTLKSQDDIVVYSYNKTINASYDENAKNLSVTFTKIKSNDKYEDATYSIKIFNNTSVLNNKAFIDTIYPFSSEVFSFVFEDSIHIKEDSEKITQSFTLSNSIENGFYMTVVASFAHNEYEINKLAYDITEIKKEKVTPVTPDKGNNNKWWIALLIIILILGFVIGGLLFYRHMKKARMQNNPRISENNQALIPEDHV